MAVNTNGHQDQEDQGRRPNQEANGVYGNILPYEDPAIVNPDELASFPKQVSAHHDHDSHVSRKVSVTEGKNMTRTDNHPDKYGFM